MLTATGLIGVVNDPKVFNYKNRGIFINFEAASADLHKKQKHVYRASLFVPKSAEQQAKAEIIKGSFILVNEGRWSAVPKGDNIFHELRLNYYGVTVLGSSPPWAQEE
jgi:hypothetical protein